MLDFIRYFLYIVSVLTQAVSNNPKINKVCKPEGL